MKHISDGELLRLARAAAKTFSASHGGIIYGGGHNVTPDTGQVRMRLAARAAWLKWLHLGPRSPWDAPR